MLKNQKLENVMDPVKGSDGANKDYVDEEITKLRKEISDLKYMIKAQNPVWAPEGLYKWIEKQGDSLSVFPKHSTSFSKNS